MNDWNMTNIRPEMVIRAGIIVYRIDSKSVTEDLCNTNAPDEFWEILKMKSKFVVTEM